MTNTVSEEALIEIQKACDKVKLTFNDPLEEILVDDCDICGRIYGRMYFDVCQKANGKWKATIQYENSEIEDMGVGGSTKFEAFIIGLGIISYIRL